MYRSCSFSLEIFLNLAVELRTVFVLEIVALRPIISFSIYVLLYLLRKLCRVGHDDLNELTELINVLRSHPQLSSFDFQRLLDDTSHVTTPTGDFLIFVKALHLLSVCDIGETILVICCPHFLPTTLFLQLYSLLNILYE